MTSEITEAPEPPASGPPDVLQQHGVQKQDEACGTTVLIGEARWPSALRQEQACDARTVAGLRC
jgi:hypothetical protein